MGTEHSTRAEEDYRASHLEKGADYDAALASVAFDAYMARIERELLLKIVPRLFPHGVPRYLDFACGTGRITQTLAPLSHVSIGVDVSASMVAQAREKCPGTEFLLRDLTVEPLGLDPVNLVSSFRFFGNAQPGLRLAALRAIHGLLRPGGYLVVNIHRNALSIHNLLLRARGETDGSDLDLPAFGKLLRETGFRIVRVYGIGTWVVRHALRTPASLESTWARWLEPSSRLPGLGRFSPDMIVVARRS